MADTSDPFEAGIPVAEAMSRMDAVQADFEQACDVLTGRLVRQFERLKFQFAIIASIGEVPDDEKVGGLRAFVDKFRDEGSFRKDVLSQTCHEVPELQPVVDRFNDLRDIRNSVVHAHYGDGMTFLAGMSEPVFHCQGSDGETKFISASALRGAIEDAEQLLIDSAAYGPMLKKRRQA